MTELKQAYETLGLQENASKADVEKRYDILLRQDRARQSRKDAEESGEARRSFDEINRAYRLILQYEDRKAIASINEEKYGKYRKYAGQAEKLDHAISYYKWHALGVIAAVALIIYGINAYQDHRAEQARLAALPPIDLEASFIGQFYLPAEGAGTEELELAMVGQIPEWKRVEADVLPINMSNANQMDIAMQQKIVVQLATEQPDVYILDADTFEWIARNGVLRNLDAEAEGRFSEWLTEGAAMKAPERTDDIGEQEDAEETAVPEHVYGINVGSSPLAKALPLSMKDMIIGIRVDAAHPDNALLLIERYLLAE